MGNKNSDALVISFDAKEGLKALENNIMDAMDGISNEMQIKLEKAFEKAGKNPRLKKQLTGVYQGLFDDLTKSAGNLDESNKAIDRFVGKIDYLSQVINKTRKDGKINQGLLDGLSIKDMDKVLEGYDKVVEAEEKIRKYESADFKENKRSETTVKSLKELEKTYGKVGKAQEEYAEKVNTYLKSAGVETSSISKEIKEYSSLLALFEKINSTKIDKETLKNDPDAAIKKSQALLYIMQQITDLEKGNKLLGKFRIDESEIKNLKSSVAVLSQQVEGSINNFVKGITTGLKNEISNTLIKAVKEAEKASQHQFISAQKTQAKIGTGSGSGTSDAKGEINGVSQAAQNAEEDVNNLGNALNNLGGGKGGSSNELDLWEASAKNLGKEFENLNKYTKGVEDTFERLNVLWKSYDKGLSMTEDEITEMWGLMKRFDELELNGLTGGLKLNQNQIDEFKEWENDKTYSKLFGRIETMTEAQLAEIEKLKAAKKEVSDQPVSGAVNKVDGTEEAVEATARLTEAEKEASEQAEKLEKELSDAGGISKEKIEQLTSAINELKEKSQVAIDVVIDNAVANTNTIKDKINELPDKKEIEIRVKDFSDMPYLTDPKTGKPLTLYRGTREAISGTVGADQNGLSYYSTDRRVAESYIAQHGGKLITANGAMKNPLEIDAEGSRWDNLTYIGEGFDEVSKKLWNLKDSISKYREDLGKLKKDSSEYKEVNDKLNNALEEQKKILADTSNPYVMNATTDEFADKVKASGLYDGLILKNIIDGGGITATDVVFFDEQQIRNAQVLNSELDKTVQKKEEIASVDKTQVDSTTTSQIETQQKLQAELEETKQQAKETTTALSDGNQTLSDSNQVVKAQDKIQEELRETREEAEKTNAVLSESNQKDILSGDETTTTVANHQKIIDIINEEIAKYKELTSQIREKNEQANDLKDAYTTYGMPGYGDHNEVSEMINSKFNKFIVDSQKGIVRKGHNEFQTKEFRQYINDMLKDINSSDKLVKARLYSFLSQLDDYYDKLTDTQRNKIRTFIAQQEPLYREFMKKGGLESFATEDVDWLIDDKSAEQVQASAKVIHDSLKDMIPEGFATDEKENLKQIINILRSGENIESIIDPKNINVIDMMTGEVKSLAQALREIEFNDAFDKLFDYDTFNDELKLKCKEVFDQVVKGSLSAKDAIAELKTEFDRLSTTPSPDKSGVLSGNQTEVLSGDGVATSFDKAEEKIDSVNEKLQESKKYVNDVRQAFMHIVGKAGDRDSLLEQYPELSEFKNRTNVDKARSFLDTDEWKDFLATLPNAHAYLESIGYDFERIYKLTDEEIKWFKGLSSDELFSRGWGMGKTPDKVDYKEIRAAYQEYIKEVNQTPLSLVEESSGQLAMFDGVEEQQKEVKAAIEKTNDAIEGQITLVDYLNDQKNKPVEPIKDTFDVDTSDANSLEKRLSQILSDAKNVKNVLKAINENGDFSINWLGNDGVDTGDFGKIKQLTELLKEYGYEIKNYQENSELLADIGSITKIGEERKLFNDVNKSAEEASQAKKEFATANEVVQDSVDDSKSKLELETELMERLAKSAREAANAKKEFVEANKLVQQSVDDTKGSGKKDKYANKNKVSEDDYTSKHDYYASIANQKLLSNGNTILGETVSTELVDGLVKVSAKIKTAENTWKTFSAKIDADGNMFEQRFRTITKGVGDLEQELVDFNNKTTSKATSFDKKISGIEAARSKVEKNYFNYIKGDNLDTIDFEKLSKEINDIINKQGKYTASVGESTEETQKLEEATQKLISSFHKSFNDDKNAFADKLNVRLDNIVGDKNFDEDITSIINKIKSNIAELRIFDTNEVDAATKIASLISSIVTDINTVKTSRVAEHLLPEPEEISKGIAQINKVLYGGFKLPPKLKSDFKELKILYNQALDGDGNVKITNAQFQKLRDTLSKLNAEFEATGKHKSIMGSLTSRITDMNAKFLAQYFSFQDILRYARQGFETIKEYDNALTEMNKVSSESISVLKEFQKESFGLADAVGTTASQIQNSTADFLRLGESFTEAKQSAQDANALLKVSEFTDVSEATDALIAMSAAYDELEKSEINDILNYTGNNFSISTSELASALQRSAATLKVAGNDIYEATALITAGNAVLQDAESVGTGLKMISLRILGTEEAKDELASLGENVDDFVVQTKSKLDETIRNYTAVASNDFKGISILDDNGNYKSTYEILRDISKVYQEILEADKQAGTNRGQALLEVLAGEQICLKFMETYIYRTHLIARIA